MKVGICGHFGGNENFLDGQTVKTKNVTNEFKRKLGEGEVLTLDTYGGKKALIKCLVGLFKMIKMCDNIFILPASNSVRIFPRYLLMLNRIYHKKLHYIVIGGWLPELVSNNPSLASVLKKLDYIYVETNTMKVKLEYLGFNNISILPNFKKLNILEESELDYSISFPLKTLTFSRVTKLKGIIDIIDVVKEINREANETIFSLDIYGPIEEGFREEFESTINNSPEYIKYMGMVDSSKSVDVIKKYFFLSFPTRYVGEGLPGTIIDSYSAGIPIISSRFLSVKDIVTDGITGLTYEFLNIEELKKVLLKIKDEPNIILDMKKNCLKESKKYTPDILWKVVNI